MANIEDYLQWRGDLTFQERPFNEIDNLILAVMSYSDIDDILTEEDQMVPLPELRDRYFERHTREEVSERKTYTGPIPLMLDSMADGARFRDTKVSWFHSHISNEENVQMAALTFFLPNGTAYVSFRGTDDTIVGWKEDFEFSYLVGTTGQREAVQYMDHLLEVDMPIMVGGHSKGGNFAVYASAFCRQEIQDRITDVWNNDGPGFPRSVLAEEGYQRIRDRIHSIIPENSIVGILMHNDVEHKVIASSEKGAAQHDARSWQVVRDHFEEVDQRSLKSFIFDETITRWLHDLSDEERHSFIESVFGVLEDTGLMTLDEINTSWITTYPAIIQSLKNLPKEKRDEVIRIFGQLLIKYRKVLGESVKETVKENVMAQGKQMLEKIREPSQLSGM